MKTITSFAQALNLGVIFDTFFSDFSANLAVFTSATYPESVTIYSATTIVKIAIISCLQIHLTLSSYNVLVT